MLPLALNDKVERGVGGGERVQGVCLDDVPVLVAAAARSRAKTT